MRPAAVITARVVWTIFYVLTLGIFTINSSDAEMRLVGWPMLLTRWLRTR